MEVMLSITDFDQMFRISIVKMSDICIYFAKSLLLRLPLKITSNIPADEYGCSSKVMSNFICLLKEG